MQIENQLEAEQCLKQVSVFSNRLIQYNSLANYF